MRIAIGATGWLGSALGAGLPARGLVLLNRGGPRPDDHGYADVACARDAANLMA